MNDKTNIPKNGKIERQSFKEQVRIGGKSSWEKYSERLSGFQADFSPGFDQKLMQKWKLESSGGRWDIPPLFRTFVLSGAAAIILILIGVYFVNGSLNLDSLLGISGYAPDLGLFSFL